MIHTRAKAWHFCYLLDRVGADALISSSHIGSLSTLRSCSFMNSVWHGNSAPNRSCTGIDRSHPLRIAVCVISAGAAACAGGNLSTDVLHAIQATLDNSSKDNAADELKDQAAQLQYLRECLSFATAERDQLLIMNKQMTALLVQQVKQAASAAATAQPGGDNSNAAAAGTEAASAAAGAGDMGNLQDAEGCSRACAAGAAGVSTVRKRATRIRRCLSYEVGCHAETTASLV